MIVDHADLAGIRHVLLKQTGADPSSLSGRPLSISFDDPLEQRHRTSYRRALWPDEAVRTRELQRQYPSADETFSLPCRNRVVEGDTIRWTAIRDLQKPWKIIDGDPPQVEAKVEGISPKPNPAEDLVTLRVVRFWGPPGAPEPGTLVCQKMPDLFTRGCVRMPWTDEEERARLESMAQHEAVTRSRHLSKSMSRGISY